MGAFFQNLSWGLEGFIQSIFVNGDLSGFFAWFIGAIINALIYGHQ